MSRILIIDDEASMREFLEILMFKEGYTCASVPSAEAAFDELKDNEYDLVLTDLKMPKANGIDVLMFVKEHWPKTQVVVMTAFSTTDTAIEAMRLGAYDYISKPFKVDSIKVILEKALERRALSLEVGRLKGELQQKYSFHNIIGNSSAIRQVFEMIRRVSHSRTSVLVSGESGTGKELVAKAIHYNSTRKDEAFVVVNCGAIPDNLMESEFFGHTKGAFTGAIAPKKGLFEVAHGGTIFLDEIAELSMTLQVKLLRVLQERRIKPVGSTDEFAVDVRVVAATNKSLEEEVQKGNFREDLYYRLNVIQMRLPALRERKSDIALIAEHFVEKYCEELGREIEGFSRDAMAAISAYGYPGNVRELENVIERAVTFETSSRITLDSLPAHISEHKATVMDDPFAALSIGEDGVDLESVLESLEKKLIFDALRKARGVRTEAAKLLNISFRSIRYKLDKYSISDKELDEFRHS